ncbi:MAG: polyhydroxybutyrate depolymerase [Betaproteobacteria bacterium]|nr:polyhydroxybutyrate depolymerase [Betaproteobacteria bacterium]
MCSALKLFKRLLLASGFLAQTSLAALAPGNYEFALPYQSLQRSYLVHVPPKAADSRRLPVVLSFHGGGSNAEVMRSYTRMDRAADRDGYIAVYPNGSSGIGGRFLTWNAGSCCGPAAALQIDDVGFSLAVLDDLAARASIDTARIYATGLSNGSMMAYRLAAEASERIAAVAGVAGAMSLTRFAPKLPVPVMHIHSKEDHIARYDGGFGPPSTLIDTRMFNASVEEMLRKWLDFDGCPLRPAVVDPVAGEQGTPDEDQSAIRREYRPCRAGVEVVLWQLSGAGHVWPGGVRDYNTQLLGTGTAVIDANAEMWRFFSRFKR